MSALSSLANIISHGFNYLTGAFSSEANESEKTKMAADCSASSEDLSSAGESQKAPDAKKDEKSEGASVKDNAREYLFTVEDCEKNAMAKLGSMDDCSYEQFIEKMHAIAKQTNLIDYKLVIAYKFKPGAHSFLSEYVSHVTKEDWQVFKDDARTMCESMPNVFVVDSSKFAIPI